MSRVAPLCALCVRSRSFPLGESSTFLHQVVFAFALFLIPPKRQSTFIRHSSNDYRRCLLLSSFNRYQTWLSISSNNTAVRARRQTWIIRFARMFSPLFSSTPPHEHDSHRSRLFGLFGPDSDADLHRRLIDSMFLSALHALDRLISRPDSTVHVHFALVRFPFGLSPIFSLPVSHRNRLLRFRLSVYQLDLHKQRYAGVPSDQRTFCPCCTLAEVESEAHFLLRCPLYSSLRDSSPSLFETLDLTSVMGSVSSETHLFDLAVFLSDALALRRSHCSVI